MGSSKLVAVYSVRVPSTRPKNKMRVTFLYICAMVVVTMSLPTNSKPDIKPDDDLIPVDMEHSVEKRDADIIVDNTQNELDEEPREESDDEDHDEDDEDLDEESDEDDDEEEDDDDEEDDEDDDDSEADEEDDDEDDEDEDDEDEDEDDEEEEVKAAEETPADPAQPTV